MHKVEWLTSKDLQKYIIGGTKKIYTALNLYQQKNANAVAHVRKGLKSSLCLDKLFLDDFIKSTNLASREDTTKNKDWLSTREITKYVYGSFDKIYMCLMYYQKLNEQAVQRKYNQKSIILCLNKNYLDDFIQYSHLVRYEDEKSIKTEEWLSSYDLKKYIVGSTGKISVMLQQFQPKMPEAIQYRKSASNNVICLHKDSLKQFALLTGQTLQTDRESKKTKGWLNSIELLKYISLDKTVLREKMREMQTVMPYGVQWKINGPQRVICVHKEYIKEFCKRAGLVLRNIPEKGRKYVFEQAKEITAKKYNIELSKKLYNHKSNPKAL